MIYEDVTPFTQRGIYSSKLGIPFHISSSIFGQLTAPSLELTSENLC